MSSVFISTILVQFGSWGLDNNNFK